jgi:hypothetical protein
VILCSGSGGPTAVAVNMSSDIDECHPSDGVRAVVMTDPRVQSAQLVGSRAAGTATVLPDWDYRISSADPAAVSKPR